jgi:hypothetical protein
MPARLWVLAVVACICFLQSVSARTQQTLAFGSWFGGFFKRNDMDSASTSTPEPKGGRMPSTIDAAANNRQTAPHNLRNQQPICEVKYAICKHFAQLTRVMTTNPLPVCCVTQMLRKYLPHTAAPEEGRIVKVLEVGAGN